MEVVGVQSPVDDELEAYPDAQCRQGRHAKRDAGQHRLALIGPHEIPRAAQIPVVPALGPVRQIPPIRGAGLIAHAGLALVRYILGRGYKTLAAFTLAL